jgi:hypothetical protein
MKRARYPTNFQSAWFSENIGYHIRRGPSPQVRGHLCLVGIKEFRDLLVDRLPKDWNLRPFKGIQKH